MQYNIQSIMTNVWSTLSNVYVMFGGMATNTGVAAVSMVADIEKAIAIKILYVSLVTAICFMVIAIVKAILWIRHLVRDIKGKCNSKDNSFSL